jgi:hypothetical protein
LYVFFVGRLFVGVAGASMMQVLHTKEEFVLDFLNVFPPTGTLNARIIVSPSHFKRMVQAMQENLKKYESGFGEVEPSDAPKTRIGFGEE